LKRKEGEAGRILDGSSRLVVGVFRLDHPGIIEREISAA
jgi:hypothetical protein